MGRGAGRSQRRRAARLCRVRRQRAGRSDLPSNDPWHTALDVAAENGDLALAQELVGLGADPSIADKHYKATPLDPGLDQPALIDLLEPIDPGS